MKKFIIALSLFLLFIGRADAAITASGSVINFAGGAGTSESKSFTTAADADGIIVSLASWSCSGTTITASTVVFNTTGNFTKAVSDKWVSGGCEQESSIWYLTGPAQSTTANVVVTYSGSMGGIYGSIQAVKGMRQTAQPDATAVLSPQIICSNPESLSITTVTDNSWIFDAIGASSGTLSGPTSPQVDLGDHTSYKANVAAGSNSVSRAYSGCAGGQYVAASFAPAPSTQQSAGFFGD